VAPQLGRFVGGSTVPSARFVLGLGSPGSLFLLLHELEKSFVEEVRPAVGERTGPKAEVVAPGGLVGTVL